MEQIGTHRARGVIIDVAALDVMDSFGSRTLLNLAHAARLRGAETVIVGIQPTVAFAMVRLGMGLDNVHTALDLEEGLEYLQRLLQEGQQRQACDDRPAWCDVTRDAYERFRRDYAPAFLQYLTERGEPGRRAAYELGRQGDQRAAERPRSRPHPSRHPPGGPQDPPNPRELEQIAQAASEFLVEALAVFEMTQRGFADLLSTARSDQERRLQTDEDREQRKTVEQATGVLMERHGLQRTPPPSGCNRRPRPRTSPSMRWPPGSCASPPQDGGGAPVDSHAGGQLLVGRHPSLVKASQR